MIKSGSHVIVKDKPVCWENGEPKYRTAVVESTLLDSKVYVGNKVSTISIISIDGHLSPVFTKDLELA